MNSLKKKIAVVQARMDSERLPGKVLMDLEGKSILGWVIERIKLSKLINEIWVATTDKEIDDRVADEAVRYGALTYRGSEENVFDRFYQIVKTSNPDIVIRVTADNPFIYYGFINEAIEHISSSDYDYVNHINNPLGTGVEVINSEAILTTANYELSQAEKEHVTLFIKSRSELFNISNLNVDNKLDRKDLRLTVDTEEDYMLAKAIFYFLSEDSSSLYKIIDLIGEQPWLPYINKYVEQKQAFKC